MTDANELLPCPFCGIAVVLFDGDTVKHPGDNWCILAADHCDLAKWQNRALIASREAAVKPLGDDAGLVGRCAEDVTMMKAVIAEANNSLYGSQSFFMSISGERPAHKYHLAEEIEKLKALSNTRHRQVLTLTRELDNAREAGGRLATCAFNLAQRAHLTINERLSLNESREQWDALSATADLGRDTENAG